MGYLQYGEAVFPMDDRTLQHVQIAIHEVARHRPSFYLTWRVPPSLGSGRMSAWISPGSHLLFKYEGSRIPTVNREWINLLVQGALEGRGLAVLPEPLAEPSAALEGGVA